jgi:mono/diheme cytochrome c family protein
MTILAHFKGARFAWVSSPAIALLLFGGSISCGSDDGGGDTNTDTAPIRGGGLYDNWFATLKMPAPTTDHPLWATRPDMTSNTLKGADTWRCKECHGWDYKGKDGAYGSGSHKTGFVGIMGNTKSEADIVDSLKNKHGYGAAGLSDAVLSDLAKFVKMDVIDTSAIVNSDKTFKGDAAKGKMLFTSTCQVCHSENGLNTQPTGSPGMFDEFPGKIASENPWEFTHKVRFGQPGFEANMPPQARILTLAQIGDLGAHTQTLPKGP